MFICSSYNIHIDVKISLTCNPFNISVASRGRQEHVSICRVITGMYPKILKGNQWGILFNVPIIRIISS